MKLVKISNLKIIITLFSYELKLLNKNINQSIHKQINMNSAGVVNEMMKQILKQGKDVLHERFVRKQKVPPFALKQSSFNYKQTVVHGGYQAEITSKYSHFTLKKDNIPHNIAKDNFAIKSNHITYQHKSHNKSPSAFKASHKKFYSSKKNNRENLKQVGHVNFNRFLQDPSKQKQNHFIKLNQGHKNRITIERAQLRDQNQEEIMREKKRLVMLKQYQQKLQNQAFLRQREDRQIEKEKIIQTHAKKGDNFTFNYDNDGELILFSMPNNLNPNYLPQTSFKIKNDDIKYQDQAPVSQAKFQRYKSLNLRGKNSVSQAHSLSSNINQNQRIRSARGEAFASAVLKTVNLSRISMNGSLIELDAEQFMKRNDLFNNNHIRQTSSIPYLQPKIGTVYTQIATNQVIGSVKQPHSSTTANLFKEDISVECRGASGKGRTLGGFYQNMERKYSKTARALGNRDQSSEDLTKITVRPIKTAKENGRNLYKDRRPNTSRNRGHITTANQYLVLSLLQ